MQILSFDLSSTRTGVAYCNMDGGKTNIITSSIVPEPVDDSAIKQLGFLPHKQSVTTKTGKHYLTYVRDKGEIPSQTEKKKRDVAVRNAVNMNKKKSLVMQIKILIDRVSPDLILVERNESFNGVLTTKLLAEIRGILEGVSAGIPIKQYSVSEIRKGIDLVTLTRDFVNKISKSGEPFPKDITKSALKYYIENKYGIHTANTDESDACMVLDYYIRNEGWIK